MKDEKTCAPIEMEELPAFNKQNLQLEVVRMIDRGQSYERIIKKDLNTNE